MTEVPMAYVIKDPIELMMREGFEDWESDHELNTQMGDNKDSYKGRMVSERTRYGYGTWFDWQTNTRWQMWQKAFLTGAEWAQNSNALENSKKEDGHVRQYSVRERAQLPADHQQEGGGAQGAH